jgi:transcriptional regulator with XRE-family HTH domain
MNKLQRYLDEVTRPKLSIDQIAEKLKVHPSLVTMWRRGTRNPGKAKLVALSKLTGIKVEDLL